MSFGLGPLHKQISELEHRLSAWEVIISIQDRRHPNWRKEMPRTMLTTGLSSEVGAVCDQVTHLDGGGSRLLDPEKWSEAKLLHDLVDSWAMIVLIAEKSGFTEADFWNEWLTVKRELLERAEENDQNLNGNTDEVS